MTANTEALARRICGEVVRLQAGRTMFWINVAEFDLSADEDAVDKALILAADRNWLQVAGQPAHSVLLMEEGRQLAGRR
jgi:hypothetical protein